MYCCVDPGASKTTASLKCPWAELASCEYAFNCSLILNKHSEWCTEEPLPKTGSAVLKYLLFGWILLSPLLQVIRGLGDAFGLHSSNTSFPRVAIIWIGLGTKTGADAVEEKEYKTQVNYHSILIYPFTNKQTKKKRNSDINVDISNRPLWLLTFNPFTTTTSPPVVAF